MPATTQSDDKHKLNDDAISHEIRPKNVWYERLFRQRLTARKLFVYVSVLAVLYFSETWWPTFALGGGLLLAAGALRIWTFGHLSKNQAMVTTGPYAHTRNPAYLGSLLALLGFGLAAGNPHSLAGSLVWVAATAGVVVFFGFYLPRKYDREYGRLEVLFPEPYAAHAANVPNLVPRLSAWRSGDDRRFSWERVSANHEWVWPIAVPLGMAAIWFF